jgi:hypothetical protein
MMNEENNMVINRDTSVETGHLNELSANNIPETENTAESSGKTVSDSSDQSSKENDGGAPLTNDEIRELMKHGGGFNNGMNPEALERLMNQPGPDTKALLERISGVLEIQDGNMAKAFSKINDLELKVTALTATNKFTTTIAIAAIIVAIVAIIL